MTDYFNFLPEEDVFFVDTCAFGLLDRVDLRKKLPPKEYIERVEEEVSKMRFLTEKLSRMDNWLTIQEVIQEFKRGAKKIGRQRKKAWSDEVRLALRELAGQKKQSCLLLKEEYRNATKNFTESIEKKIEILLPKIQDTFMRRGGKIDDKNTDCKLISTALAYAEDMPVGIFSHDRPLLHTFSYAAVIYHLPIKRTYIIDERNERTVSTEEYLEEHE